MKNGFASLPTMIVITALLITVSIGIASISFTELLAVSGERQTREAYLYAETGARDALLRVAKNKNYSCFSGTDCPYQIVFAPNGCETFDGCAFVQVNSGAGTLANPKIITSIGRVRTFTRAMQITIIFDAAQNGEIASVSWQEL